MTGDMPLGDRGHTIQLPVASYQITDVREALLWKTCKPYPGNCDL
ncbi:MAG: hypothetical protein HPY66_2517 [Firmicutes bacterium]|nr:hypothetical protein [Bacillota bacterium]